MAGVMSNSDELVKELSDAGEVEGEKIWRLPLGQEQRDFIKSESADIVNSAGREGHPLQGGAFLSYFVPEDDSVAVGASGYRGGGGYGEGIGVLCERRDGVGGEDAGEMGGNPRC